MKCCSRSTLGVVIGILNVLGYIGLTIFSIVFLIRIGSIEPQTAVDRTNLERSGIIFIVIIVLSLIMTVIAGLLIMGIVKRLHKLMMPWLILSAIGFVCNCARFVYIFFSAIFTGVPFTAILIMLVTAVLGIGLSGLILWGIFTLYGDIRKENIEKSASVMGGAGIGYKMQGTY